MAAMLPNSSLGKKRKGSKDCCQCGRQSHETKPDISWTLTHHQGVKKMPTITYKAWFAFLVSISIVALCAHHSVLAHRSGAIQNQARVIDVTLKPDDPRPSGQCAMTITFGGSIRTDGPGTVKYTFTRSDGATGP